MTASAESQNGGVNNEAISRDQNVTDSRGNGKSEVDTSCGVLSFKPAWMQSWNNGKMILVMLSVYATVQGFVCVGLVSVNMATLERRFELSSSQTGLIASSYDITSGLIVAFVGYFARTTNMPRLIGISALMMSIGSLITVLPHFVTEDYHPGERVTDTCPVSEHGCVVDSNIQNYMYVLILGQIFLAFGGTTLFSTGVIYLDENVSTLTMPLFYGIFEAFSALGPALGFIVGGVFLDFYVDFEKVDTTSLDMTPKDPRWVGAWWLGFAISIGAAFVTGLIFFCFGRETPKAEIYRKNKTSQTHQDGSDEIFSVPGFGSNLKDLPKATWLLLKNPTFMLITIGSSTITLLVAGFGTFFAKYIENQLYQTKSLAAILSGGVLIPGAAGGVFAGGLIVNKMKLKVRGMLKLSIISVLLAVAAHGVLFARCDAPKMAGINVGYESRPLDGVLLTGSCNKNCSCSTASRTPVCGSDGIEYFSACHAGCTDSVDVNGNKKLYTNCSCVGAAISGNQTAVSGLCETDCGPILPVFIIFLIAVVFFILLPIAPMANSILRVVPDSARSYAFGIHWVFLRFLGSIPGPIIFGYAIDQSCSVWQEACGEKGSCWMYDNLSMSLYIFGLGIGFNSVGVLCYILALLVYKLPKSTEEDRSASPVYEVSEITPL